MTQLNNEAFEKWIKENIYRRFVFNVDKEELLELWQAATAESDKRIVELESEISESDFVIKQTTTLLAEICLILKGEPPAKTLYGYHDLPKMVRELQAHINVLREALEEIKYADDSAYYVCEKIAIKALATLTSQPSPQNNDWNETRMDIIGQNGPTGDHYK